MNGQNGLNGLIGRIGFFPKGEGREGRLKAESRK